MATGLRNNDLSRIMRHFSRASLFLLLFTLFSALPNEIYAISASKPLLLGSSAPIFDKNTHSQAIGFKTDSLLTHRSASLPAATDLAKVRESITYSSVTSRVTDIGTNASTHNEQKTFHGAPNVSANLTPSSSKLDSVVSITTGNSQHFSIQPSLPHATPSAVGNGLYEQAKDHGTHPSFKLNEPNVQTQDSYTPVYETPEKELLPPSTL